MRKACAPSGPEALGRENETVSCITTELFTPHEDDLNFHFLFLLLSCMNNVRLHARAFLANRGCQRVVDNIWSSRRQMSAGPKRRHILEVIRTYWCVARISRPLFF